MPFFYSSIIVSVFWYVSHSESWEGVKVVFLLIGYSRVTGHFSKEILRIFVGRRSRPQAQGTEQVPTNRAISNTLGIEARERSDVAVLGYRRIQSATP